MQDPSHAYLYVLKRSPLICLYVKIIDYYCLKTLTGLTFEFIKLFLREPIARQELNKLRQNGSKTNPSLLTIGCKYE